MSEGPTRRTDRWALLIGIDRYLHMPEWNLKGAVRDVEAFEEHLCRRWSFPAKHVRKLTDAQASQAGIREAMTWLEDRVSSDDLAVVFYSGHGSWRQDSKTLKRRADGREKTLVPCDSGRHLLPSLDIGGDEIHERLQKLVRKTPYVTVILDCCHSGTLTRTSGSRQRGVEPDVRSAGFREAPDPAVPNVPAETPSGWFPMGGAYTLIAACRSDQTAVEMELPETGGRHGILTHFLLRTLEPASAGTTYQDVVDSVMLDLEAYFRDRPRVEDGVSLQEPQLEGVRNREIFGRCEISTMRYVEVIERLDTGEVLLAGGSAHSLKQGAELEVYPRGTKRAMSEDALPSEDGSPSGAHSPIGRVRVIAAREVKSSAQILTESKDRPIRAGDRAVPSSPSSRRARADGEGSDQGQRWEDLLLVVRLESFPMYAPQIAELRACIEDSPLIRLAKAKEEADLIVLILPSRKRAGRDDALPALGTIEAPSWAMTRDLATLRAPLHPVGERRAINKVFRNLEQRARWQALLELQNPDSPLAGKVDLVLLRKNRNRTWEPTTKKGEDPVFRAGERFAFEITNHYSAPVFAYVLDLGFGGGIGQLYPVAGAWEALKSGRSVEVGTEREVGRFYSPRDYPYHPDSRPSGGREREVLKLIVTTEKTDFRIFFQEGYRDPGLLQPEHRRSVLGRILSFVAFGSPLRDDGEPDPVADDEWATVECRLWIDVEDNPNS